MAANSPAGPLRAPCFTAGTTGSSQPINCAPYPYVTVYVTASAALSAGTLIVEEADYDPLTESPYGGTWSTITTVTLSSVFGSAGGQSAIHIGGPGGGYAYAFLRVRIGTTVVGGTLAAVLRAC